MEKGFDRILVVMLENQYRQYVRKDPFMRKLAMAGADMGNYFGAFHPSQTNYLASLAGEVCAVTNDDPPVKPLMQETLVDVLETAGASWKAYMEGYPGEAWKPVWKDPAYPSKEKPCEFSPDNDTRLPRYFRKHNAFASFHSIQSDEARWNRIVGEGQFWDDVAAQQLPDFAWFSPDIWNDGHYLYNTHLEAQPRTQLIPQISAWLEHVFLGNIPTDIVQDALASSQENWGLNLDIDLLLTDPQKAWQQSRVPAGTLIVITFDEADFNATGYDTNYDGPNQVYTVLLGDMIAPGTIVKTPYNHYSLMKTIENNFGASDLGKNDRHANWFRFLWDERFTWSSASETGLSSSGDLALTTDEFGTCLVYQGETGDLLASDFDGATWSQGVTTGIRGAGKFALANLQGRALLVYTKTGGELFFALREAAGQWSAGQPLGQRSAGDIAMTCYHDCADGQEKIMLCWQSDNGFIYYLAYQDGDWQEQAGEVGQLTDGPLALGQLGDSLFLVYKERNRSKMRMTSYNLAPFNAFAALNFEGDDDPANYTSLNKWSPFDVAVGNFSGKYAAIQNDYKSVGKLAMASIEGEMHLAHRGAFDDTPQVYTEYFGLTGIFTAADPMGNGWGTINQAGWTLEQALEGVQVDPAGGIAMAGDQGKLVLVWQEAGGKGLKYCCGGYGSING